MQAPPSSGLTNPVPHRPAPLEPARGVAARRDADPPAQERHLAQINGSLTAIAHAIPSQLLVPWLPGALGTLSRRGGPR
jgi:hypothetical protein